MDANGVACISGYGLGPVLREMASSESSPAEVWCMAPEITSAENGNKLVTVGGGKRADVYSLGMVMCEVSLPLFSSSYL